MLTGPARVVIAIRADLAVDRVCRLLDGRFDFKTSLLAIVVFALGSNL